MKFVKFAAVPLAVVLAVGLSGCGGDGATETSVVTTVVDSSSSVKKVVQTTNEEAVAAVKAVQASRAGKIVSVEREDSDACWKIKILDGNKVITVLVDFEGKITDSQYKVETLDFDDQQEVTGMALPVESLIVKHSPKDAILDEAELDFDDGRLVWELKYDDVQDKDVAKVKVDAASGDVVQKKMK